MSLEAEDGASPEPEGARSGLRSRVLDDPVVIRALAHPLRHDLMGVIGHLGRATTAQAARELGISHGLASHHLRQLAKYGWIERVAGKNNQERPWRLVATSYTWDEAALTREGSAAVDVFERVVAERTLERFVGWQQRRGGWPEQWREHTGLGTSTVYLTPAELAEVTAATDALLMRYVRERPLDDVAARPPGSVAVDFTVFAIPAAENPPGQD